MTVPDPLRVRALFEAVVDLPPDLALRRLDEEQDAAVRDEVRDLLHHHAHAGTFLEQPPGIDTVDGLEPGTAIGPYSIVRALSAGGMGQVYLALDTRLDRHVCVKAVRPDLLRRPGYRERLKREARVAAALNHPGLCVVHALESVDDQWYLVTEFVDGRTLREELADGPPAPELVARTAVELADALGALHEKGIVHRDLKPENIMRTSSGRVKILDFGLARSEDGTAPVPGLTLPGPVPGTPAYMAPEQIAGGPIDRRADLFALAVTLYEYATGTHPFAAASPLAVAGRILEHAPVPLRVQRPDIAPQLAAAVDRCLEKDPARRPASTGDIIDMLRPMPPFPTPGDNALLWWRIHQAVVMTLYLTACVAGWWFDRRLPSVGARWAFLALGLLATTGGIARSHLLFTRRTHPGYVDAELRRTRRPVLAIDVAIAVTLCAAAALGSADYPVRAALSMGLAAGIALATVLIEPATTRAAFPSQGPPRR